MPITQAVNKVISRTLPRNLLCSVENLSGADPVHLHDFASGQIGRVKLLETVHLRRALIQTEVQIRASGQQSGRAGVAATLLGSNQRLVGWIVIVNDRVGASVGFRS